MKFKVISRSETEHTRERRDDVLKVQRNPDPLIHPFERAREYTRALNATKLNKVFSKPFIGALDGHMDGVWCMAASKTNLSAFITGAADGDLRVWDLPHRRCLWNVPAHTGFVRAVSVASCGQLFYTCGDDNTVKLWKLTPESCLPSGDGEESDDDESQALINGESLVSPIETFVSSHALQGLDCHWSEPRFATCGEKVDIWDRSRNEPVSTFAWSCDSVRTVRFNPAEANMLASAGGDRSISLYDIRQDTPLRKMVLSMKSNALAWNPMEPSTFVVANEDHNLYSFDMRNLSRAIVVHKDHVGAVMDVSFSPTGKEFCTASYDRTVRLFKSNNGKSYQVYHTNRMQRVFCSIFSSDASFVLSGSDDTVVRIWKANASKPLGRLLPRERRSLNYSQALINRYKHVQEINRIHRHQNVPKAIRKEKEKKRVMRDAARTKTSRRLAHDPNFERPKPERSKAIVKELV